MLIGVALAAAIFHMAGGETGKIFRPQDFQAMQLAIRAAAVVAFFGAISASLRGGKAPDSSQPAVKQSQFRD
jgi:hypothetical protein